MWTYPCVDNPCHSQLGNLHITSLTAAFANPPLWSSGLIEDWYRSMGFCPALNGQSHLSVCLAVILTAIYPCRRMASCFWGRYFTCCFFDMWKYLMFLIIRLFQCFPMNNRPCQVVWVLACSFWHSAHHHVMIRFPLHTFSLFLHVFCVFFVDFLPCFVANQPLARRGHAARCWSLGSGHTRSLSLKHFCCIGTSRVGVS